MVCSVILVAVVCPGGRIGEDKLEEERRLFYVALTRCKKELHIFTSNHNKSQFISEISKYPTLDPFVPDLSKTTPTRRNKTMSH